MKIELFGALGLLAGVIFSCSFFWVCGFDFNERGQNAALVFILSSVIALVCWAIARSEAGNYYNRKRWEKFENETRK